MTPEGEQQEAVCGACGGVGMVSLPSMFSPIRTCPDCNGTGRIPAPVVPSDERPVDWRGTGNDRIAADSRRVRHAPPTPSQDAEGDGWRLVSRDSGGSLWTADDDPHYYEYVQAGIESAIRAPYEALVKAVIDREARYGWWDDSDSRRTCGICNEEGEHEDGCPVPLAESLGGRKDA